MSGNILIQMVFLIIIVGSAEKNDELVTVIKRFRE